MTEFNFIPDEELEVRKLRLLDEFAAALRSRPGQWAEYPLPLKTRSAKSRASEINNCSPRIPRAFRAGGFDARIHDEMLVVRFVGDGSA